MISDKVTCLNHGFVELTDSMGSDNSIVRAARVSYANDLTEFNDEKDEKLLDYLLKNRHTSPFEHVSFTFHVSCPIFVARQWQRHRTGKYNEISARYAELPEEFFIPPIDTIGLQSKSNKQMRTFEQNPHASIIQAIIEANGNAAFQDYHEMLKLGCPREIARTVLPVGTYTRFYFTMDLHNLMHFLELRLHEHAQYEIQVYGHAILELITPIVPAVIRPFRTRIGLPVV